MSEFLKSNINDLVANSLANDPPAITAPAQEPPKKKNAAWWAHLLNIAGAGADAGSTIYALKQPDIREGNPLYGSNPSAAKVLGIKAGSAALTSLIGHLLGKSSPTAANIGLSGLGAAQMGIAAHNMNLANKAKKRQ